MKSPIRVLLSICVLAFSTPLYPNDNPPSRSGSDIAAVFKNAQEGHPLCFVALGGSITQAGKGWIGPWLKETFPNSQVTVVNAGMSGTGSGLGVFRVGRDVIDYQPDVVAIEYCVNDEGENDEDAIRYVESLVVRLKSLPQAPAIIILESASEKGVNLSRHRAVAQHYGLLEVDLQQAVDQALSSGQFQWHDLFGDSVHPNENGHALYAKAIEEALTPLVRSTIPETQPTLPKPLSVKPLILDGHMVRLSTITGLDDWTTEQSLPFWWDAYFNGYLVSSTPNSVLKFNVHGTSVGLHYPKYPTYGRFYVNVDGGVPREVIAHTDGSFGYTALSHDLAPGIHTLRVVLPLEASTSPVKLGYLLIAGVNDMANGPISQGPYDTAKLQCLSFTEMPLSQFKKAGPFPVPNSQFPDGRMGMNENFQPLIKDLSQEDWESVTESNWPITFSPKSKNIPPALAYLKANVSSAETREAILAVKVDYYAQLWLNGESLAVYDGPHGAVGNPLMIPITLNKGSNDLLVKVASGSNGHAINLAISEM